MTRLDLRLPRSWDTAAAALAACARALGDPRDPATLSAASGLAFRISLDGRLTSAGPHAYPWREELTIAAERLGCRWRMEASTAGEPLHAAAVSRAYHLAVEGVAAGRPTLLFGVQLAEFGLVRGVDGRTGELYVSGLLDGLGAPDRVAASGLDEAAGILFALQLVERLPFDEAAAARSALRAALGHARGGAASSLLEAPLASSGVAAWRLWQAALESGDLDPPGLAFAAQRYAEARAAAAAWLPLAAAATGLDLYIPLKSWRRSAAMLGELARLLPYPPGEGFMLTSTLREQALALVVDAARAEADAAAALAAVLAADQRAAAGRGLELRDLDPTTLPDLFACVAEIPIEGLRAAAADCRAALAPRLGEGIRGKLLYQGTHLVGHILWAPLAEARYPVKAEGNRWFVYCPWLERGRRGEGVGARLFAALDEAARGAGVDGLLTVATSIDVFLHHHGYEKYGFEEVGRRGPTRLLERRLTSAPSCAYLVDPPPAPSGGPLPVVVRHGYNCPLLLHVRRDAARLARAEGASVALDEADARAGEPCGVTVGGLALAHGPIPAEHLAAALQDSLRRRR